MLFFNWRPEMGRSWAEVAAGDPEVDALIDRQAAHLRANYNERIFLSIHAEPEEEVRYDGSGHTAANYAAMYRYVILRLRAKGATNVVSVMNYIGLPHWGSKPWYDDLYPGDDVVDWIAADPYLLGPVGGWYDGGMRSLANRTFDTFPSWPGFYTWVAREHPSKPIMLAEWGVDELPGYPDFKARNLKDIAANLHLYPNVKGLVYWNSNKFGVVGTTRIDSSTASLAAFRALVDKVTTTNSPVPPN
jgi:beta-mannanase